MSEWSNEQSWKDCVSETVPRVRIPPLPQFLNNHNMKKIFLSYKFTGEDINGLNKTVGKIISTLRSIGYEVFCTLEDESWFQENKKTNREIIERAFQYLNKSDITLVFVHSNEKSEGMMIEIGYAIAKNKPIILALQRGIKTTFLAEMAKSVIEFDSIDDLCDKLGYALKI